jgi:hypothetical protein
VSLHKSRVRLYSSVDSRVRLKSSRGILLDKREILCDSIVWLLNGASTTVLWEHPSTTPGDNRELIFLLQDDPQIAKLIFHGFNSEPERL